MTEVQRFMAVEPSRVFAVLADGWSYPLWVVGAAHMRDVDEDSGKGSRIHHSVGVWPSLIEDDTEVLDVQPDHRLELSARAWPTGSGRIVITLEEAPGGTFVRMEDRLATNRKA